MLGHLQNPEVDIARTEEISAIGVEQGLNIERHPCLGPLTYHGLGHWQKCGPFKFDASQACH